MPAKPRFVPAALLGALLVCLSVIPPALADVSTTTRTVDAPQGAPLFSWWRAETHAVFGLFLSTGWLEPLPLIDPIVTVEHPASAVFRPNPGAYSTKDVGPTPTQDTINEDINPFDHRVVGDPEDSDPRVED
jgi:hypothetical protein